MPPKNYSNITVRAEVREELEKLRKELGFRNFSNLLVFLVRCYREYTSVSSKLDELLTRVSSISDLLQARVYTPDKSKPEHDSSNVDPPHRDISYPEASYQNDSSKLSGDSDPQTQDKLANILKQIIDKVKDLDERVSIIEHVYWSIDHVNKAIQVYEGDSEEGRKIPEEVRQKGKLIDRSEGNEIDVEVYEV
jgi:hypothetical protein